ncbi:flagellar calcium-binding protein [Trypanosoma conorhini]|uniref:Flagellar calcium-binding protein n=1 Tax=Trypanosoma conorhini TaxID=83891 RepID=A0A422NLQ3_9TRYP|nr:flagellar calcium-binding protein [Trypanosoma conorhini]RNF06440.1 flagellar calcium-binding protein [Trypanosoma conorhini]
MGGCGSKEAICGQVYLEMLRRVSVAPTHTDEAAAASRRSIEFVKILGMHGGCDGDAAGGQCVTVEQLQQFDRERWQLSSVHAYNDQLLLDAADDIFRFNNPHASDSPVVLRRCDYRPWLLCMCEFYNVMGVFEKAKLLSKGTWEKASITAERLTKCLGSLKTEFALAFASDKGPGAAFQAPASLSASAVVEEASRWSLDPLSLDAGVPAASPRVIPLVALVRWLVLRHVVSLCGECTAPPAPAPPVEAESAAAGVETAACPQEEPVPVQTPKRDWGDAFASHKLSLRRALGDPPQLEALFLALTHGTRRLSEADATTGMHEHFSMGEMFEDQSVHDALVRVAFHVVARDFGDGTASVNSVPPFAQFLRAYLAALELYRETMQHEGATTGTDPRYGAPAPALNRATLAQVLKAVGGDAAHDGRVAQFVYSFFGRDAGSRQVPFLEIADPWTALLLRGTGKRELRDISELYYALGLCDEGERASIFSLLVAHGWAANDADAMFNALKAKVDFSLYCHAAGSAGSCARSIWVKECERWGRESAAAAGGKAKTVDGHDTELNRVLADVHLKRLLHGVYGAIVAAGALEKALMPNAADGSRRSSTPTWALETAVPTQARSVLLREAAALLEIQGLGEAAAKACEKSTNHSDIDTVTEACDTASSLLQLITSQYVNNRMREWRQEAWRRLHAAWPVSDEDTRLEAFLNTLMQREGKRAGAHSPFSESLYKKYASDVLLIMPKEDFQALCPKALSAVGDPSGRSLTPEYLPAFMRYILGYMHVLISFGVPHIGHISDAAPLTWEELGAWVRRETGAAMDGAVMAVFNPLAGPHGEVVPLQEVAVWFARRESLRGATEARLRIWQHRLRERLPVGDTASDRSKRRQTTSGIRADDGYIPLSALMELCSTSYELWRVWPPELGSSFVSFCVRKTNDALQRGDLQDAAIHHTDLRFLLLFVRAYLDVLLDGACAMEKEGAEGDAAAAKSTETQGSCAARQVSWTDGAMRSALQTLLRGREVDEETLLQEVLDCGGAHCTTALVALTVARSTVVHALRRFCEKAAGAPGSGSLWERLRQRLPSGESKEERLKRQQLFARMDVRGSRLLTLCDLYRGMVDQLALQEFREDLQPIIFRAFFATKEVTSQQRNAIYLVDGEEQFITATEFRAFLWYVYAYFEQYYMFDALCKHNKDPMKKSVSLEAFVAAAPLLQRWGCRIGDPAAEFRGINGRCKEGGAMYFTDFAVWASLHHLSPAGYSHEEAEQAEQAEQA